MSKKINLSTEWHDINIAQEILSQISKLSSVQERHYFQFIRQKREQLFKGKLGESFLRLWEERIRVKESCAWELIQRDIQNARACMRKGKSWDYKEWKAFYIYARHQQLFQTELGKGFLLILGKKLVSVMEKTDDEPSTPLSKHRIKINQFVSKSIPAMLAICSITFFGIWFFQTVRDDQSRYRLENEKQEIELHENTIFTITTDRTAINLKNEIDHNVEKKEEETSEAELQPELLEKYSQFYEKYPDLYGWVRIDGTQINYPVMRAGEGLEDDFYLHHTYEGEESIEGAIFVDPECELYPKSKNIVIYGHNMRNGEMFGSLKQFADEGFMQNHKHIQFDTIYEEANYEVIAVLRTRILNQNEDGFRYYRTFQFRSIEEYNECENFINENRLYGESVNLRPGDEILMLSTCEYSQENGRFVVVALKEG